VSSGDRTFHCEPHPIPDQPANDRRGPFYVEGVYVDVWQWKAPQAVFDGWMDECSLRSTLDATPMRVRNVVPYKGGFAPDPGVANYSDNFIMSEEPPATATDDHAGRLPRILRNTAAMGEIDIDPNHARATGAAGS